MLKTNNDYLTILLFILLIFVMLQKFGAVTRIKGYDINIPQTIEQLYQDAYLLPENKNDLSKSEQLELLQQAQTLRRISKSTPIQIVRYQEPKEFIDKYFELYPEIKTFMDSTIEFASEAGYVLTLSNRRRYIPLLKSNVYMQKEAAKSCFFCFRI